MVSIILKTPNFGISINNLVLTMNSIVFPKRQINERSFKFMFYSCVVDNIDILNQKEYIVKYNDWILSEHYLFINLNYLISYSLFY